MPRKPSSCVVMRGYPPLSARRFHRLKVDAVERPQKAAVRFVLAVAADPQQAGRIIRHELPAVLAPGSPLACLLAGAFGIRLAENETLDLASLAGREFEARFTKHEKDMEQTIAAVRPVGPAVTLTATPAGTATNEE